MLKEKMITDLKNNWKGYLLCAVLGLLTGLFKNEILTFFKMIIAG